MKIELSKKPKSPTIVEGFPGFGLVGTISTGFLIDHLNCEKIGRVYFEDAAPTIAIHDGKVIDPISIYYNKKYNLIIVHSISNVLGLEWKAAGIVLDLCKQLSCKELISIEGVGAAGGKGGRIFYYTTHKAKEKALQKIGIEPLNEGIIVGVTSSLLLKGGHPMTAFFAESISNMPDSKAAAKVIESLDGYLGLKVDYKPLLKQAQDFENKLKQLLKQGSKTQSQQEKKRLSYIS